MSVVHGRPQGKSEKRRANDRAVASEKRAERKERGGGFSRQQVYRGPRVIIDLDQ